MPSAGNGLLWSTSGTLQLRGCRSFHFRGRVNDSLLRVTIQRPEGHIYQLAAGGHKNLDIAKDRSRMLSSFKYFKPREMCQSHQFKTRVEFVIKQMGNVINQVILTAQLSPLHEGIGAGFHLKHKCGTVV